MVKEMDYAAETRRIDINSAYLGVPKAVLMENAGREVAKAAERYGSVAVFCGAGNNGGDGLVAARHLSSSGKKVIVYLAPGNRSLLNQANLEALEKIGTVVVQHIDAESDMHKIKKDLDGFDLLIDALLGVGASGELREPIKSLVDLINSSKAHKLSVDVPTPGVKADEVVSFHIKKAPEARPVDIGIPKEAESFCGPGDLLTALPKRTGPEHKGDFGRVLVIGGSREYIGAPYLAAKAASMMGADLVYLACPQYVADHICFDPNLITRPVKSMDYLSSQDIDVILGMKCDSVVLGNGIARSPETRSFVKELSRKINAPLVVDADALRLIEPRHLRKGMIITPHRGEFVSLFGELPEGFDEGKALVEEKARKTGAAIVLKGPIDIVSDGETTRSNRTGNPGMTVGGTGDVLAGIIGVLAAKADLFGAACAGAFLCGLAGDLCVKERGPLLSATDVIEMIRPAVMHSMRYDD